ncbi:TldD/PmbA family protein [Candidatus Aminicenantes bacterium AC-334-K16]|jgi:PmbA protein|nr:TldD/PmbA family protein [Candidatus Aminicenantes bacterium AC-334-K16]
MKPTAPPQELLDLATDLVNFALAQGADEVEVAIGQGEEFNVDIRNQEIENLTQAQTRGISLRLIKDKKSASASSSDLKRETLEELIKGALGRLELTQADPWNGLPEVTAPSFPPEKLQLYDPKIQEIPIETKIELARQTEKIALQDKRITNSHGASFSSLESLHILANSKGFAGAYEETSFSLSVGLQAGETDNRAEDFWGHTSRFFDQLEPPEEIARQAVKRTTRLLHPRKIPTQQVPVVFEPEMTAWLLGFLFVCVSGTAIYQKTSFLVDKLGQRIAGANIDVIDDGLLPGKLGTRPFDREGVPCRRTQVISRGQLNSYLLDTYSARRLGLNSTGNASGSGVRPNNFHLQPGSLSPEKIISSLDKGFLLVRTIGHGLNPVTGEISRGAFGLWIEKGELAFPVAEVTISGNLQDILNQVIYIGNDLKFRSAVCGPTIAVEGITIAGN